MEKVDLSIVIPVYNSEKYIKKCIDSVLNQTFDHFELILVDDGSSDASSDIIDSYLDVDSRIRVIHQDNKGAISARNAGLQNARGEYITFIDSDDWIDSDMYLKMMNHVYQNNSDIVACGFTEEWGDKTFIRGNSFPTGAYKDDALVELKKKALCDGRFYTPGIIPSLWSKIIKKSLLLERSSEPPLEVRMGDDGCITYLAIANAKSIVVDNSICSYHYRIVASSMAHAYDKEYFMRAEKLFGFLDENLSLCKDMKDSLIYYKIFIFKIGIEQILSPKNHISIVEKINLTQRNINSYIYLLESQPMDWIEVTFIQKQMIKSIFHKNAFMYALYYFIDKIMLRIIKN